MAEKGMKVCVTGAGGFIASWLIKRLLLQGYAVNGTVRNIGTEEDAHLGKLENAAAKLRLFKADLLDYDSILASVKGCDGVFHLACPVVAGSVPDPEVEIVQPAQIGTRNVLRACSEAKVRRVVLVSSIVSVAMNPNWPKDEVMDESCWTDRDFCRKTNNWYCFAKTVAEAEAWDYAKSNGLDLLSVCPGIVLGPMLQPTLNSSSLILLQLLQEGYEDMENSNRLIVDVRDVAEAIKSLYEKPEAEGRYICTSHAIKNQDLVQMLKEIYPNYNYPKSFKEGREVPQLSSEKLQRIGWKYMALKETLVDSVENYKQLGYC